MDNFDDLVYSIRYEAEAILENLKEMDDLDGDEAKVSILLKWIKSSAISIENKIEDYQPNQGITTAELRSKMILSYPGRAL